MRPNSLGHVVYISHFKMKTLLLVFSVTQGSCRNMQNLRMYHTMLIVVVFEMSIIAEASRVIRTKSKKRNRKTDIPLSVSFQV